MPTLNNSFVVNNGASSPYGNGVATIIEGFFPASQTSATQNVGELNERDFVEIVQLEPIASFPGFVYDPAGSTLDSLGGTGIVSIVPAAGGLGPTVDTQIQVRIFRNP